MAAAVDIANLALGRIGHQQQLSALPDQTAAGRRAAATYPNVLARCLQRFRWPWAEVVTALTLSATEIPGWSFAYQLPEKCLSLTTVCDANGARMWTQPQAWRDPMQRYLPQSPYRIFHAGSDDDAALICTDVEAAYAIYVRRVENVNRFPPLFYSYVAWELAAELALVIKTDADLATTAIRMAKDAGPEAAAASMNEALDDPEPDSPSILARG